MRDLLLDGIKRFNEKTEKDEKLRDDIKDKERLFMIVVTDDRTYNFKLKDSKIGELGEGEVEKPDVVLTSDSETLTGVYKGQKDPITEYSKGRLKVKASLMDMLFARKIMSSK